MLPEHPFTDIGQVGGSFVLAVCGDSRAGALPALHARILPDVGVNMGACRALRLAESRCQTRLPRVSQRHDSGLASCAYVAFVYKTQAMLRIMLAKPTLGSTPMFLDPTRFQHCFSSSKPMVSRIVFLENNGEHKVLLIS